MGKQRISWGDRHTEAVTRLVIEGGAVVPFDRLLRRTNRSYRHPDRSPGDWLPKGSASTVVHQLRTALGNDAIVTVPGLGYSASDHLIRAYGHDPAPTLAEVWLSHLAVWLGSSEGSRDASGDIDTSGPSDHLARDTDDRQNESGAPRARLTVIDGGAR